MASPMHDFKVVAVYFREESSAGYSSASLFGQVPIY
jgi:hypothetical protein